MNARVCVAYQVLIAVAFAQSAASLTIDNFEEGAFAVTWNYATKYESPYESEQTGFDSSNTIGGVRHTTARGYSTAHSFGVVSAGLSAPTPLTEDGMTVLAEESGVVWLRYDGTPTGTPISAGLSADLSPFSEIVVQVSDLEGPAISGRLFLSDAGARQGKFVDLVEGANVFPLSAFPGIDLANVREIFLNLVMGEGTIARITDISAVGPPVLYVNDSDPICGDYAPCYATIQSAVDDAEAGSIVRIQAGEYDERVNVLGRQDLVIEGDPAADPEDVRIAPSDSVSHVACKKGVGAIEIGSSSGITLRHLTVRGYGGFGVRLRGGLESSQGVEILGLRVLGNGQGNCGGGIAVEAGNADSLLAHNTVHANDGSGVCFERNVSPANIQSTFLWGNTIQGNGKHGVLVSGFEQPRLYNNLIAGNGADPALQPAYGVARGASGQAAVTGDMTLRHNLICGNASGELDLASGETPDAIGNLTPTGAEGTGFAASPGCDAPATLFADGAGADSTWGTLDDDFFLATGSPAIDAGAAPPTPGPDADTLEDDFALASVRPADGDDDGAFEYDMGALEWGEAPTVSISAPADGLVVTSGTEEIEVSGPYTGTQPLALTVVGLDATQSGGASGSYDATAPLAPGGNTLEAVASNAFGLATDSIAVRRNQLPVLDAIGDQSVPVGSTLTLQLSASDADGDPLQYSVAPLPLPEHASFNSMTGLFKFAPDLDQVGDHVLTFGANDGIEAGVFETITVTVTGASGVTGLSGVILDANDAAAGITTPLQGVTVRDLDGTATDTTDANGAFTLTGLPAGERRFEFDGSTEGSSTDYGSYRAKKDMTSGVTLVLDRPIYLPRIDATGSGTVTPASQSIITNSTLGVTLTIPPYTVRYANGSIYSGPLSISEVPAGFTPGSLPDTLEPSLVLTIQPMGLVFLQPVPITLPNVDDLAPGTQVNIWSMDHATSQFFIAGVGEVSTDGQWIETISGGVVETSWHIPVPPAPLISADESDGQHDDCDCTVIPDFASDVFVPDGAMKTAVDLPAYVTQGESRGLRLVYRSDRASPYPAKPFEPTVAFNAAIPDLLSYKMTVAGVELPNRTFIDTGNFDTGVNNTLRASLAFDAGEYETGVYPTTTRVTSHYGDFMRISAEVDDEVVVVNERDSAIGAGWGLGGLQKVLHDDLKGTALVIDGGGDYARFGTPESAFGSDALGKVMETMPLERFYPPDGDCDFWIQATTERTGVVLTSSLETEVSAPGATSNPSVGAAVIPTGTAVTSHLLYSDTWNVLLAGSITFDRPILGVIVSEAALDATDAQFGHPDTDYSWQPSERETLDSGASDRITISDDRHTLEIQVTDGGSNRTDQVRVFTEADPGEENTVLLVDAFNCENGGDEDTSIVDTLNWTVSSPNHVGIWGRGPQGQSREDPTNQNIQIIDNGWIESKTAFDLEPGVYTLSYAVAGRAVDAKIDVSLGSLFSTQHEFLDPPGPQGVYDFHVHRIEVESATPARIRFDNPGTGTVFNGPIAIDNVRLQRGDQHVFSEGEFASSDGDSSRLIRNNDGTFTRHYKNGSRLEFATSGLQTAAVDRNGNQTSYAYDGSGRLETITDPTGAETDLVYSGDRLSSISDPSGRYSYFDHDAAGNLLEVTLPDGSTREFTYNARHLLIDEFDGRGLRSNHEFDDLSRLVSATLPDGSERLLSNAQTVGYVDLESGAGSETMPAPETGAEAGVSTFTDAEGRVITYDTGALGATTAVTDAAGLTTQTLRDPRGNPIRIEHPSGHVWTRAFDDRDNLLRVTDEELGGTTSFTYHPAFSRPTAVTDGLGTATFSYHDTTGDLLEIETAEGRTTNFTYAGVDAQGEGGTGQLDTTTDPLLTVTDFDYFDGTGEDGNLKEIRVGTGAAQRVIQYTYTSEGYVDTLTQVLNSGNRVYDYDYDDLGRLIRETVNPGQTESTVTEWAWDDEGNLETLTPPGQPAHVFRYDLRNREEEYEPPPVPGVGPRTYFDYDRESQLTSIDPPGAGSVSFGYHATSGRLETTSHPAGTRSFFYTDGGVDVGLVEEIVSEQGDELELNYAGTILTEERWKGTVFGGVSRTFDPDGRLDSQTVDDGTTTHTVGYAYDADGLLEEIQDAGGNPVLSVTLDAASGLIDQTALGSVTTTHAINAFGETDDLHAQTGGSTLYREEILGRDRLGRITSVRETVGVGPAVTRDYTYDRLGRLDTVKVGGVLVRDYAYDPNGNRTGPTAASHDDQDRLTAYGNLAFTHTESGELATKTDTVTSATTTYGYDLLGNLRSVSLPSGNSITYVIDGADRRVGKKVNGTLTQGFLYGDALNPVAELNGSSQIVSRFVYGTKANVPDYLVKSGTTYRVISDHLGSVRLVVNASTGVVAQRIDYDEWGNVTADTNPGFQPFAFAGGLYDGDTKLTRFGARDYDAETGRWTIKDPIRFDGGTNLYGYVMADPVNLVDEDGLRPSQANLITSLQGHATQAAASLPNVPSWLANSAAGFGDVLSFGLTGQFNQATGADAVIDECSTAYGVGQGLAYAHAAVSAGTGIAAANGWRASLDLYKHGGGGINVLKNGARQFGLDWHAYKQGGSWVSGMRKLHAHYGKTKSQISKHRPLF